MLRVIGQWGYIATAISAGCALQPQAPVPDQPSPAPGVIEGTPQIVVTDVLPADDEASKKATEFLTALKASQSDLRTVRASLVFDILKGVQGDQTVRKGAWYYEETPSKAGAPRVRKSAARFDKVIQGKVVRDETQIYVFDGEWLIEKRFSSKTMTKQRMTQPGQIADPMAVEGKLPIPVGQDPQKVLQRFDAQLVPPEQDLIANDPDEQNGYANWVKGAYQLKLTLKDAFKNDSEIRVVQLWYDRAVPASNGHDQPGGVPNPKPIPKLIRVQNRQEDVTLLRLSDIMTNTRVPPDVMDTTTPPDGWDVVVQ